MAGRCLTRLRIKFKSKNKFCYDPPRKQKHKKICTPALVLEVRRTRNRPAFITNTISRHHHSLFLRFTATHGSPFASRIAHVINEKVDPYPAPRQFAIKRGTLVKNSSRSRWRRPTVVSSEDCFHRCNLARNISGCGRALPDACTPTNRIPVLSSCTLHV